MKRVVALFVLLALVLVCAPDLLAHGVSARDKAFMEEGGLLAFLYLGAKHMVTGYDHLLFLLGVIFFLYRLHRPSRTMGCPSGDADFRPRYT